MDKTEIEEAFRAAIGAEDLEALDQLIVTHGIECRMSSQVTPLIKSVYLGSLKSVEFLLNKGADVFAVDGYDKPEDRMYWSAGKSALHHACREGNPDIVSTLLSHVDDVDLLCECKLTPLVEAAKSGSLDIVRLLLKNGAAINAQMTTGRTPLSYAVDYGHMGVVCYLIERGADVNQRMAGRWTPLLSAVAKGHYEIAELLIRHGADVTAKMEAGWGVEKFADDKMLLKELLKKAEECSISHDKS